MLAANSGTYTFAYVGTFAPGNEKLATQTIFKGSIIVNGNTVPVVFKTSFDGSVGGIADLVNGLTVGTGGTAYPNGGGGWLTNSNLPMSGGQAVGGTASLDPASVPDVTLSDCFQASTPFTSTTLSGKIVAVVPFVWVKGLAPSLSTLTSITSAQAYDLLKGSYTFNGAPVYAIGANEDSGARLAAFEDASGGTDNGDIGPSPHPSVPKQYQFAFSGTPLLWPAPVTVGGYTYTHPGHSGYASDEALANVLNQATTVPYIGYLGINDATSVNRGNNTLKSNFYVYSVTNVGSGAYAFWDYEHVLYLPTLNGTALSVVQQLESYIVANSLVSGVPIYGMKIHREGDGTKILSGGTPPNVP